MSFHIDRHVRHMNKKIKKNKNKKFIQFFITNMMASDESHLYEMLIMNLLFVKRIKSYSLFFC